MAGCSGSWASSACRRSTSSATRTSPESQGLGVGGALLTHLRETTDRQVLVGTWAAAGWAIRFYERHGFTLVAPERKAELLRAHWSIPERQIETSVVLALLPERPASPNMP